MAANTAPIFEKSSNIGRQSFTSADTTAKKTLFTAGSEGSRVDSISCCTNDTAAVNMQLYLNDGSTDFYLGVIPLPIGAGYTTIAKVEGLASLSVIGVSLGYIFLPTGYLLKGACLVAMTALKTTDIVCFGGDF